MGRKAFGVKKKKACDSHHCKKLKKEQEYKFSTEEQHIIHSRVSG